MSSSRRLAGVGHKLAALRDHDRRTIRSAALAAPLVTLAVVGGGVAVTSVGDPRQVAAPTAGAADISGSLERRADQLDRSAASREPVTRAAAVALVGVGPRALRVSETKWTTTELNLRVEPEEGAKVVDVLASRAKVVITGRLASGFAEVRSGKKFRWVSAEFLADERPPKPEPVVAATEDSGSETAAAPAGTPGGACADSSVESGLVPNAIAVHRAVCGSYPQISEYIGLESRGDHGTGQSLDVMTYSDSGTGWQIAEYLRANAGELGIDYIIFSQKIWSVDRAGEGWRAMEDRGSATANHYDHVHVTVY